MIEVETLSKRAVVALQIRRAIRVNSLERLPELTIALRVQVFRLEANLNQALKDLIIACLVLVACSPDLLEDLRAEVWGYSKNFLVSILDCLKTVDEAPVPLFYLLLSQELVVELAPVLLVDHHADGFLVEISEFYFSWVVWAKGDVVVAGHSFVKRLIYDFSVLSRHVYLVDRVVFGVITVFS